MQIVCLKCSFEGSDEENRSDQITLMLLKISLLLSLLYLPLFVPMSLYTAFFIFAVVGDFALDATLFPPIE